MIDLRALRFPRYKVDWFLRSVGFDIDLVDALFREARRPLPDSARLGVELYKLVYRRVLRVRGARSVARLGPAAIQVLQLYGEFFGADAYDGEEIWSVVAKGLERRQATRLRST